MLSTAAFIIGMVILGLCFVVAALLLSGAINGAATALKESAPQSLQQPTLTFLTEYDAADYLGISLNELDYIRSEGLLDGAFIAVTSLEKTGEESYVDYEDGVEVSKTRPVMSNVTRFLFNRQLLDEKMMEAIKSGKHINPFRSKSQDKKQGGKKNKPEQENKKQENRNEHKKNQNKHPVVQIFSEDDDAQDDTEKTVAIPEDTAAQTESAAEVKAAEEAAKPKQVGPPKPMGPIGDDDDDVIDIMDRINSAKQQSGARSGGQDGGNRGGGNRPNNGNRNGGRGNNGGHNSHNRGNN